MNPLSLIFFLTCIILTFGEDENEYGTVIGIDLGTTYSCVGVWKNDHVEIIANEQGNRITPSYIAFTDEGRLVGDAAKNQATLNPTNTVFDAKRLIGRTFNDKAVQKDAKMLPFKIIDKSNKPHIQIEFNGETQTLPPEQVSAMVLRKLKEQAEAYLGETVTHAVVTVPAYFNDAQRQATKDAGNIAGLNILRIINEPTAAAIAYGLDKTGSDKNVLVFDLGGGTFDVSILNIEDNFFEVLATAGDTHLGGEDFDQRIMTHLATKFKKATGLDVMSNKRAQQKLRKASEQAKRALSSQTSTKIQIDSLLDGHDFSETLTRATFERLNNALFRKTLEPVETVLKDSGLQKEDIDEIVLVGGSTRIPKIQSLVSNFFNGKKPSLGINPDEAVAVGAAIQGGVLSSKSSAIYIIDVTPLTLGIETVGGVLTDIMPRGTRVPATKSKIFSTAQDNQDSVVIQVFEGERKMTKDNHLLGSFKLEGIPPARRGVPQIEVTFNVNEDGLLHVAAEDQSTGKRVEIEIESTNLSDEEVQQLIQQAKEHEEEDERIFKVVQTRQQLDTVAYQTRSALEDEDSPIKDQIDSSDYETVMAALADVDEFLSANPDADLEELEEQLEIFNSAVQPIMSQFTGGAQGGPNAGSEDWYDEDSEFDL